MYSRKYLINTASGLQKVDGLDNSSYFINLSNRYITGNINSTELQTQISHYYSDKKDYDVNQYEADLVASRITEILEDDNFILSPGQLIAIHKRLFEGVLKKPGQIRQTNFKKKEWILNEQSVLYGDFREIDDLLAYDFNLEKRYDYANSSIDEKIEHISDFISNIWQAHPFEEGNTRTTAVFLIKYLRTLGLDVSSDIFKDNAWYFRNALVRANYRDPINDVYENKRYLIMFLRNMILNEKNQLSNKLLNVGFDIIKFNTRDVTILKAMLANPKIKIEEIAKQTDLSVRTVKYSIANLKKKNILQRLNGKQKGHWLVKVDI